MGFYNRPSLAVSRQTVGSITLLLAPFSAQLVLTGMTPSELPLPLKNLFWYAACARALRMTKSQWRAINGHFWYMLTACMILRNLGKDCFGINYLFGSIHSHSTSKYSVNWQTYNFQAFKHIFTSPSSVDLDPKATRSGNARIHGMTRVTTASLAYVATQVRP
jgi:hypothetical protein